MLFDLLLIAAPFATVALLAWLLPPPKDNPGSFWVEGDDGD